MKLVCISDTHEMHHVKPMPDGDVFIHAGDFTMLGESHFIARFAQWLESLPHKHKILVPGNHELGWTVAKQKILEDIGAIVLLDSSCEIEGVKFYGSPYTPAFMNWAFQLYTPEEAADKWSAIPTDTKVLITHGPPWGILDRSYTNAKCVGDAALRYIISRIKPKLHVFGHIHGGYGRHLTPETVFINASLVNEAYQAVNKPHVEYI